MSSTIERKICPTCQKKNLCTFQGTDGKLKTICKTDGCSGKRDLFQELQQGIQDVKPHAYVDSTKLDYQYPTKVYRGISPETCVYLGIKICQIGDTEFVSYDHYNLDGTTDTKYRYPNKIFSWKPGKSEKTDMFGLDKCTDFSKPLYITEGNEDTATLVDLGCQACSLLSAGSEKDLNHDYLKNFHEISLCIEKDKAGLQVIQNLKDVLHDHLIRMVDLSPRKDANDWVNNKTDPADISELKHRLQSAIEIIPPGILFGNDLKRDVYREIPPPAFLFPWKGLNTSLYGLERGCLYGLYAGSTTGKSTFLRELVYHLRTTYPDVKVANLFFEESQRITPQLFLALDNNIPLGKLKRNPELLSPEMFNKSWDKLLNTDKLMFPDKSFKKDCDSLIRYIRYLVKVKKFDIIVIDHISYIIGRTTSSKQGERKDIDKLIYDLQDLTTELNCVILYASHITKKNGEDAWDKGAIPDLYSGRGSGVLAQAPDGVIALSRNNTDPTRCNILDMYCLKSRWDGDLGLTDSMIYIKDTGRLIYK